MAKTNEAAQLKITLVKSSIGCPQNQKDTVKALGLRKLHMTVLRPDNDAVRGQIRTVRHLVNVEEV